VTVVGLTGSEVMLTVGAGGGLVETTSQVAETWAFPPGPVASTTKVCLPGASPLYDFGASQTAGWRPSSVHFVAVAFSAFQSNVAVGDVVGLVGCAVSWSVGGGGVPATTFQFTVVVAVPHLLLSFRTKVWAPTERFAYVAGLWHSLGGAPSNEQDASTEPLDSQLNPATEDVVVEEGYEVSATDGVLPPAAPLAVFQIVSVTSTSAADANTSRLRVCVMAVWGGWG
jgi:hypothetical protein